MSFLRKMSLKTIFCDALAQIDNANFKVTFWDGSVCEFGNGNEFNIHFNNKEVLKRVLFDAPHGFGEGYMNHESVRCLMFDDHFIRMWRFYLAGCSVVFKLGSMHLFQLLFSAGVRNDLPLTREWMVKDYSAQDQFSLRERV